MALVNKFLHLKFGVPCTTKRYVFYVVYFGHHRTVNMFPFNATVNMGTQYIVKFYNLTTTYSYYAQVIHNQLRTTFYSYFAMVLLSFRYKKLNFSIN